MNDNLPNYLNYHGIDPSRVEPARRIDTPPGNDSIRADGKQAPRQTEMNLETAIGILKFVEGNIYERIAIRKAIDALRGPVWVKTEERLPTESDADNDGYVEAYWDDIGGVITTGYDTVINDNRCSYWLPRAKIPPLPEVIK